MAQPIDVVAERYKDAVQVVLEGINMRVDPRKVLWCNYPVLNLDSDEIMEKAERDTKKLQKETANGLSRTWYVGIPKFKLIKQGVAHLSYSIEVYYVACDISNGYT